MTRAAVELRNLSGAEAMTRLLAALASLGADDEIEVISGHDCDSLRSVLEEHDCACEQLHGEEGRCVLLIRRRP